MFLELDESLSKLGVVDSEALAELLAVYRFRTSLQGLEDAVVEARRLVVVVGLDEGEVRWIATKPQMAWLWGRGGAMLDGEPESVVVVREVEGGIGPCMDGYPSRSW